MVFMVAMCIVDIDEVKCRYIQTILITIRKYRPNGKIETEIENDEDVTRTKYFSSCSLPVSLACWK